MKKLSLISNMQQTEDDKRLLQATIVLSIFLGFTYPFLLPQTFLPKQWIQAKNRKQKPRSKDKIFPVIIEQSFKKPAFKDQYRALSEFNTDGSGGITTEYGFHTLSNTDVFEQGSSSSSKPAQDSSSTSGEKTKEGNLESNPSHNNSQSKASIGKIKIHQKIPTNYRFQKQMVLRYDGQSLTAVATQSMPGATYFRGMIRQIRRTFAPPGLNYIIRDPYGYRMNQAINPQIVSVQFAISIGGKITDVKVVSSIGQIKVDKACVEVLKNKNFGKPPLEIFRQGNIFGINFVFPDLRKYK